MSDTSFRFVGENEYGSVRQTTPATAAFVAAASLRREAFFAGLGVPLDAEEEMVDGILEVRYHIPACPEEHPALVVGTSDTHPGGKPAPCCAPMLLAARAVSEDTV